MEVDATKAQGEEMTLNFAWYAGTQDGNDDWGYPAQWKVMYRIDGGAWKLIRETATGAESIFLRIAPVVGQADLARQRNNAVSQDQLRLWSGLSAEKLSVPAEAFGHKVTFRITPASNLRSLIRSNPADDCILETNRIKNRDDGLRTLVRFGDIFIDYRLVRKS